MTKTEQKINDSSDIFRDLPSVAEYSSGILKKTKLPGRLGFSLRETADLLGISYPSVWRLLHRGRLRSSRALRKKIIPRSEIQRFLEDLE